MIGTIYADGSEREFLKEVEKRSSEINSDVEKIVKEVNVPRHIRTLPEGYHASPAKIAEATCKICTQ